MWAGLAGGVSAMETGALGRLEGGACLTPEAPASPSLGSTCPDLSPLGCPHAHAADALREPQALPCSRDSGSSHDIQ
jgi:hypothetical protein